MRGVCIFGVIRDTSSLDFPSYVWILKAMERCCVRHFVKIHRNTLASDEIRAASLKSLIFGPTQAPGKITDFALISYRGVLGFTCLTGSLWAEV